MPETLVQLVWILGVGIIAALTAVTSFFFVRLINGLDSFKKDVSEALNNIGVSMNRIHNDLDSRVKIIEVAGCIGHRSRRKSDGENHDEG